MDTCPFYGASDQYSCFGLLVMVLWVSKPEWALFALGRGICDVNSLRFISLMTSMAASNFSSHACFSRGRLLESMGIPPAQHSKALTTQSLATSFYILRVIYFLKVYNLQSNLDSYSEQEISLLSNPVFSMDTKSYDSKFQSTEMHFGGLLVLVWTMLSRNYLNTSVNS